MACALAMAIALPEAYSHRAWLFVAAYNAMSLIRSGYMAVLFRGHRMAKNFFQLLSYGAAAAVLWCLGATFEEFRLYLWMGAVAVDQIAP